VNRGRGIAQDVRMYIVEKGREPEEVLYQQRSRVEFNDGMEVWLSLTKAPAVVRDVAGVL
jgi:hypothetical protein